MKNMNNNFLDLLDLLLKGYEPKDESSKCCESCNCNKKYDEKELKEDNKDKNEEKKFSVLLDYLDSCLDTYYNKLQKYIDEIEYEVENNKKEEIEEEKKECDCTRKIEIKNNNDSKEEEKKPDYKKTEFLDSMDEVPETIKNNSINCAVEYFDKIIYPSFQFNEDERKHIIEVLSDFMCWFYKNK